MVIISTARLSTLNLHNHLVIVLIDADGSYICHQNGTPDTPTESQPKTIPDFGNKPALDIP
jgi:hypothetical protein